eukprot:5903541-Alexandrium_andersonii.AAC.1
MSGQARQGAAVVEQSSLDVAHACTGAIANRIRLRARVLGATVTSKCTGIIPACAYSAGIACVALAQWSAPFMLERSPPAPFRLKVHAGSASLDRARPQAGPP